MYIILKQITANLENYKILETYWRYISDGCTDIKFIILHYRHTSVECIITAICDELYELATCFVEEQPLFFGGVFGPLSIVSCPQWLCASSSVRPDGSSDGLGTGSGWVGLGQLSRGLYKMCIVGVSCPSANRSAFQTDSEGCSNNWELLAKKVTVKSSKSLGGGIHSGHASAVEETIWVANIRTLWT